VKIPREQDLAPAATLRSRKCRRRSKIATLALGAACALAPVLALGQSFEVIGGNIQKRVNGVLALMGYLLTPDVTTGSLSISNDTTQNPDIALSTLGGGFTLSRNFPLYLEGTAGYARYDPVFLASDGQTERSVSVKWNAVTLTGGIGWDFPIARELVFRPIFNFSWGNVESDAQIAGQILQNQTGRELAFLQGGEVYAYGLGGSLMLDYEHYRRDGEIDVELRYSNIRLQTYGSTSPAVQGSADANSVNLWSRWRAPTGVILLDRPFRYVLEYTYTRFLGDLDGVLGFNNLHSAGVGLELDSSKYGILVTRWRLIGRYKFGDNVRGYTVGIAISF
jgi:hypothetical protein